MTPDLRNELRDALSDLVDACYTEGSSRAWLLCGVCETEHHVEAMLGDQTHTKGCAVDEAEKVLRKWQACVSAPTVSDPQPEKYSEAVLNDLATRIFYAETSMQAVIASARHWKAKADSVSAVQDQTPPASTEKP